jgi:hypothetical protein
MVGVTHVRAVEASKNTRQQKVQNAHPVATGSVDARALSAHGTGDHAGASLRAPPVLHTHTVVGPCNSRTTQGTLRGQGCPLFRIPALWLVNYRQQEGQ